jgi:hypothetical protein
MTEHSVPTPHQIQAFRYWIQGYQNFYEPIIRECFRLQGYTVVQPGFITRAELQQLADDLFNGHMAVAPEVPIRDVVSLLRARHRLQPDALLEGPDGCYLVECKSWGGFAQFDERFVRETFIRDVRNAAFLLANRASGRDIVGKILVLSSPCDQSIDEMLSATFRTQVRTLHLDELLREPDLRPFVEQQLAFLDAAVAEVKRSLLPAAEAPDR